MSYIVRRAGIERLDALAPLWIAMQEHHEAVAPPALTIEVAQFREHADSWRRRRASYASWFGADSAVLHVAEADDGNLAGYAMVRLSSGWSQLATPDAMAELESLSVAAAHRGRGVGSLLLSAVHADLRERGIEVMTLAVLAGNDTAARLYARHGMRPVLTHMIGRVPPGPEGSRQASATRAGGGSGS